MADEEKVVVQKNSGGGIIPLITLVMVVVSIIVSAISLIQVMSVSNAMKEMATETTKSEGMEGVFEVGELDTWNFTEQFIFQYKNMEDPGVTDTVVVDISLGILNNKETTKDAAALKTTLTSKENIIRSGVESMMTKEQFADFQTTEGLQKIKGDLLQYLQERLVSDLIVDVYFTGKLTTSN